MAVDTDICNSALIKLGAEPINALSDNTKQARLCSIRYRPIRDAILRSAPWGFAIKRASLTPVVVTLEFGDELVFQLPADCVRVWKLNDGRDSYKIEGRKLLSEDIDTCEIFYVSSDIDVNDYDAVFVEAVACALAADISYSMTQSQALMQGLTNMAEWWIGQARSYNSQEQTPESFKFDAFLNARIGGGADEIY